MSAYDVIIVGCGPVGALAANLLGKSGLSVLVLEKQSEPHPLPRAVHLDHEMMRLFQSAGVIDRVLPDMRETDGHLHIGADQGVIRYMGTVGAPRTFGWANDYFFYQPELEAHLRRGFGELPNVELRTGANFAGLAQHGDSVTIDYVVDGEPLSATARWVIGCDGSHSPVRKALGVDLDDLDFDEPWLVVDAEVAGPISFPPLSDVPEGADLQRLSVMMCDPKRPATIVPGRGMHRRWEFMLLPGEDDAAMSQPEQVGALVGPWVKDVPHRIIRAATYRFHGLVAEQWQVGNVFLAGDAAHQTPPFFGQGMCHGFRDVANLAWKMAAVAKGTADRAVLDSYQPERDPHVRSVIGAAVAAGRYICLLDPDEATARDAAMRAPARSDTPQTAADLIPAIASGMVLSGSKRAGERFIQPLVRTGEGAAKLDDVVGGGWRLFARHGDLAPESDVVIVNATALGDGNAVLDWLDRQAVDAVLVRPDHYVFGTGEVSALLDARSAALGIGRCAILEAAA
jgi:3-(3-hydroxy-phenyl)propionate hydroxylase